MKTKKIVALLLTMAVMLSSLSMMCIGVSAVEVQTQVNIPDGVPTYELNGVTYTVIRTAAEMNEVAAANPDGGVNYILADDIDYTGMSFNRIALFNGSFNGNGHSITGLNVANKEQNDHGFGIFASTIAGMNNGTITITNLTVGAIGNPVAVTTEVDAWKTNGSCRLGTLFGYIQGTVTLENVTVYANVTGKADFRTGGMIGEARGTLVMKNCVFNGKVIVDAAGNANCPVGGLIGHCYNMSSAIVENCASYGEISYANGYAGGLIGGFTNTIAISNCVNYATVTGTRSAGLIADVGEKVSGKVTMTNCLNAGTVVGTKYAAGLLGYASKHANELYNDTLLVNCANIGSVTGDSMVGALVAMVHDDSKVTITNCGDFGTVDAFKIYDYVKAAGDVEATLTTTAKTAAEALTFVQENCSFAMFGLEDGKLVVKTVPAEAKFLQYKKDAEANKMDIRVIGVLNTTDLEKYANVGFNVSVYDANGDTPVLLKKFDPQTTTTVYTSVRANEGNTISDYSAADLGAAYLFTLELRNIPMSGSYVLEITAFATENDQNNTIVSDSGITVAVIDGIIQ